MILSKISTLCRAIRVRITATWPCQAGTTHEAAATTATPPSPPRRRTPASSTPRWTRARSGAAAATSTSSTPPHPPPRSAMLQTVTPFQGPFMKYFILILSHFSHLWIWIIVVVVKKINLTKQKQHIVSQVTILTLHVDIERYFKLSFLWIVWMTYFTDAPQWRLPWWRARTGAPPPPPRSPRATKWTRSSTMTGRVKSRT